jgi:hypothetical protein
MFFLHDHPIIILFNSRASHDFFSLVCAKKAKLSLVVIEAPYVISTSGGQVDAYRIVKMVALQLVGQIFHTNLIILSGQGIDAILGMSWMKLHKVVWDIVTHLVHLNSHVYGKVTLHLPAVFRIKASLHHIVEKRRGSKRYMWSESSLMSFRMIYYESLLRGVLILRLSCSLLPPPYPRVCNE